MGSGDERLSFFALTVFGVSGQLRAPVSSLAVPVEYDTGGAQNRPEDFGGENNLFPLPVMNHASSMVTVHTFTVEAHKMGSSIGDDTEGVTGEVYVFRS